MHHGYPLCSLRLPGVRSDFYRHMRGIQRAGECFCAVLFGGNKVDTEA